MSRARAILLHIACNAMWSISGVVTRQLEQASGFEVAFWRNVSTVLALVPLLAWLALLGSVQLALPCVLAVYVTRVLPAPEIGLSGLLEILLGATWAWRFAGEKPSGAVPGGGALVLTARATNEALGLIRARRAAAM